MNHSSVAHGCVLYLISKKNTTTLDDVVLNAWRDRNMT